MTEDQWKTLDHFKSEEFDSPDAPGSSSNMDYDFMRKLDLMRERAGIPFRITSGYRTKEHNAAIGGARRSAHTKGFAADIAYKTTHEAWLIVDAAWYEGINRIEVNDGHIHVDTDPSLPKEVLIWGKSK